MIRTILSHDIKTARARVRFEHNDVTVEDDFQLDMIFPGTKQVFEKFEMVFDEEHQMKALDSLTNQIESMIESGALVNTPSNTDDA